MRLPTQAKLYIAVTFGFALLMCLASSVLPGARIGESNLVLIGITAALAALLSLYRVYDRGNAANYDVAWTLYGFTLFYEGLWPAVLVIAVANIVTWLSGRYAWPWYVHVFNISSFVISSAVAHALYGAVMQAGASNVQQIAAMLIGIVAFTLINHAHVAGVVWFSERISLRKSGFFSATSLLADISLLAIGALCVLIVTVNPWAIILAIAPLFLSHSAMRIPLLQQQAETDAKTGLSNSKIFAARAKLEFERAQRLDRPLSLVMVDLDLLREINNTHGHLAGDAAIRSVAQVLRKHARADDVVARFGGEEFALLMVETGEAEGAARAEALRADIAAAMPTSGGNTLRVTASVGVAVRKVDDPNLDALIKRADAAMYEAKRQGRNCVRCAVPA